MPERARPCRRHAAVVVVLTVAAGVGIVRWTSAGDGDGSAGDTVGDVRLPLAVEASSLYQFDDLASMVAASDLVVRARVDTTTRGRLVGDGEAAVVSRIDTLEVEEVLAGDASLDSGSTLLVEEEGWLGDGTAIAVNGLAPSEAGMDAIWFLDRRPDRRASRLPGHQPPGPVRGRRRPLEGADGQDPLVARVGAARARRADGRRAPSGRPQRARAGGRWRPSCWSTARGAAPTAFHLVRRRLWAAGHEVYTPSLTGVGERVHLTGPGSRCRRTSPTS